MNCRLDKTTGLPLSSIGEPIINVQTKVHNDFQIRCYRNELVELQVGETVCLHTAFVEQNYARVQLTRTLHLDLFFTESVSPQSTLVGK